MPGKRTQPIRRDIAVGALLSLPFFALALFSAVEVWLGGRFWLINRCNLMLCCWGIVALGTGVASISVPAIVGNQSDSRRLKGWATFLVGSGCAITGGILEWFLLARRNAEHPSSEPFKVIWLLVVAWVILVIFAAHARRLEKRSRNAEDSIRESSHS